MDGGRELNKIGAATENDLSPYVTSFEQGMFRVIVAIGVWNGWIGGEKW